MDQQVAKTIIGGVVRKGLAVSGPVLVEGGWIDADGYQKAVVYLTPFLISIAWSALQKLEARRRERLALALRQGTSLETLDEVAKEK